MTPQRAYRLGWNASARPGHNLERDEDRFLAKWGQQAWHSWSEGWEDYALGHEYESGLTLQEVAS